MPPVQLSATASVSCLSASILEQTSFRPSSSVEYTASPIMEQISLITGSASALPSSILLHFAVTLRVTSPGFTYGAIVGLVCLSITFFIIEATADSPMPNIRITRVYRIESLMRPRYGNTPCSNMGFISLGGPGRSIAVPLSDSIMQPGAVPTSFFKMMQPSGSIACFILFSGITLPRELK